MRSPDDIFIINSNMNIQFRLGSVAAYLYMLGSDEEIGPTLDSTWNFLRGVCYIHDRLIELSTESARIFSEENIQYEFYEGAKLAFGEDKNSIRLFFMYLYRIILGKDSGSRWGQFVSILGIENFLNQLKLPEPFK